MQKIIQFIAVLNMILISIYSTAALPMTAAQTVKVPRYDVFEQTFDWDSKSYTNPWEQVQVTMTLTSPTGKRVTVGGFYYGGNIWKARFAPAELGLWSWQAVLTDGKKNSRFDGSFTAVKSDSPGFVRQNPNSKFRWVFDNGTPYYPIGIGDCVFDRGGGIKLGMDGGAKFNFVGLDTYFAGYGNGTFNLFRWSVGNCAFDLKDSISPDGNVYNAQNGILGDTLVQAIRQNGMRCLFSPFNQGGARDWTEHRAQNKKYIKYCIDRYGAYIDFWDLVNEGTNSDEFLSDIAAFIKANDPYRHPITTSFADYIAPIVVHDLPALDFTSPHIYDYSYVETEFLADTKILSVTDKFRSYNKPIIVGEWGNEDGNYAPKSALRMRLRNWAAFFGEVSLIYWNTSWDKVSPRNMYLGVEERGYVKVLQDFTKAVDSNARMTNIEANKPTSVRGYALTSPTGFFAYLHAFTNHQSQTSGTSITIEPKTAGYATWIEPATGRVLATGKVLTGRQTLTAPPFLIDGALKISSSPSTKK